MSGTSTITATNAVIDGVTWNGALSGTQDVTADLIGISLVKSNSLRFSNDGKMSYFGKIGLTQIEIKNELKLSGTGTIDGVAYNAATPVLETLTNKGTSISIGGGIAYSTHSGMLLSAALEYTPNVGGGFITESNLTTLTFGISKSF